MKGLDANGVLSSNVILATVPGAVELSSTAAKFASINKVDAVICLGAVIRGDTSHFDFVCHSVTQGITSVSVDYSLPVVFGVLTTDTLDQAIERASNNDQNKGLESAITAIEMATLFKAIDGVS
ncbi:6,7-dimethyl-8-ribityllumazine synthase [Candidatus Marinamargulisbacteria bacterium SCGC AAA071-K20]|nr:6,7-dimethyl-8-ribityllumazine synthase [Candidatus Marinamargulisbacteria bacterium SCGC AAA071-K20]